MQTHQAATFTQGTVLEWYDVLGVLRRRWWAVGLVVVLCTAAVVAASIYLLSPVYQATAVVRVRDVSDARGQGQRQTGAGIPAAEPRTLVEYSHKVTSAGLLQQVAKETQVAPTEELQSMVRVKPIRDTNLLSITVRAANSRQAAELANAVSSQFVNTISAEDQARKEAAGQALRQQAETVLSRIVELRTGQDRNPAELSKSDAYFETRMDEWTWYRRIAAESESKATVLRAQLATLVAQEADAKVLQDMEAEVAALQAEVVSHRTRSAEIEAEAAAAAEEAKALSTLYLDLTKQASNHELSLQAADNRPAAEVLSPAVVPSRPVSPDPVRNGAAAGILSLVLVLTVIFLIEGAARSKRQRAAAGWMAG